MIDISYTTENDYSGLNLPKFIKIHPVLNTILIPSHLLQQSIQPSDKVNILLNGKLVSQKAGLDCGLIKFYDKQYYFFHIIPGFKPKARDKFEIILADTSIELNTYFDSSYSAKLINGLIILPNNYDFIFSHCSYCISLINNNRIFTHITKQQNKYNYYMGNTNNTLLSILDSKNTSLLYAINDNYLNDSYISTLYNKNFPLGKLRIELRDQIDSYIKINNNLHKLYKKITVDFLPSSQYNIGLLDKNYVPLNIDILNNEEWNTSSFSVLINKQIESNIGKKSSIRPFLKLGKPLRDFGNLLINLQPYDTKFTIIGPDNFNRSFNTGYQKLMNISAGNYIIKFRDQEHSLLVIKNDNNYFSNIENR